mmetsp:Transcript_136238/g.249985  ORF Transcript_136238/g.249985 Transcript_136238/m.249985 type:complete len:230 (-) Transcript_136238:52-741(-)
MPGAAAAADASAEASSVELRPPLLPLAPLPSACVPLRPPALLLAVPFCPMRRWATLLNHGAGGLDAAAVLAVVEPAGADALEDGVAAAGATVGDASGAELPSTGGGAADPPAAAAVVELLATAEPPTRAAAGGIAEAVGSIMAPGSSCVPGASPWASSHLRSLSRSASCKKSLTRSASSRLRSPGKTKTESRCSKPASCSKSAAPPSELPKVSRKRALDVLTSRYFSCA